MDGESFTILNGTGAPDDEDDFEFSDVTQRVLLATLLSVVAIVGFLGNMLVILAVALSRRLQTATNVFVTNLASADIMISMLLWFHVVSLCSFGGWPFSETFCVFIAGQSLICLGCSTISLSLIALNRCFLITTKPTRYLTIFTPVSITVMVALSWVYPIVIIIIGTQSGLGELGYSERYKVCTQDTGHKYADYLSLLGGLAVLLPSVILIMACYSKIYLHILSHTRHLWRSRSVEAITEMTFTTAASPDHKGLPSPPPPPVSPDLETVENSVQVCENHNGTTVLSLERKRAKRARNQQVEITKNLFLVVCAFMVCVLPATIVSVVPGSDTAVPWVTLILVANSCINPLIYASRHPNFKVVFRCILSGRFSSIPEPNWRTKRPQYRSQRAVRV